MLSTGIVMRRAISRIGARNLKKEESQRRWFSKRNEQLLWWCSYLLFWRSYRVLDYRLRLRRVVLLHTLQRIVENYVAENHWKVYLADDESLEILDEGQVNVKTANDIQWKLQKVKYVPGLRWNIISISQIDSVKWQKGGIFIYDCREQDFKLYVASLGNLKVWHMWFYVKSEKGKILPDSTQRLDLNKVRRRLSMTRIEGSVS